MFSIPYTARLELYMVPCFGVYSCGYRTVYELPFLVSSIECVVARTIKSLINLIFVVKRTIPLKKYIFEQLHFSQNFFLWKNIMDIEYLRTVTTVIFKNRSWSTESGRKGSVFGIPGDYRCLKKNWYFTYTKVSHE